MAGLEQGTLTGVMVVPSGGCSGKYSFPRGRLHPELVPLTGLLVRLGISKHPGPNGACSLENLCALCPVPCSSGVLAFHDFSPWNSQGWHRPYLQMKKQL